jgi:conjugative relaxase-like TrwC/TraI family protein
MGTFDWFAALLTPVKARTTLRFPLRGVFAWSGPKRNTVFQSHKRAVQTTLKEFEAFAATRIRIGGARNERLTGNFVTGLFQHDTSRALDPHFISGFVACLAGQRQWLNLPQNIENRFCI